MIRVSGALLGSLTQALERQERTGVRFEGECARDPAAEGRRQGSVLSMSAAKNFGPLRCGGAWLRAARISETPTCARLAVDERELALAFARALPAPAEKAKRDKAAAVKFLKRIMKKYGRPRKIVTDGLRAYSAAMREVGNADRQEVGRGLNNRAENSHQPFRRRERAIQRFRSMKTLQKFSSVHAQVHNHFNHERHLIPRQVYKQRRSATLAEWRALAA